METMHKAIAFITGMFLATDFTGMLGRTLFSPPEAPVRKTDRENLASDWNRVGNCFRSVMNRSGR